MTDKQFEYIWDKTCVLFCITGIMLILFGLSENEIGVIVSMFVFSTMIVTYLVVKLIPEKKQEG